MIGDLAKGKEIRHVLPALVVFALLVIFERVVLPVSDITIMLLHPLAVKLVGFVQIHLMGYDIARLCDWQLVSDDMIWKICYMLVGIVVPALCAFSIDRLKSRVKI